MLANPQPFEASAIEVKNFFAAIAADPIYVRMCTNRIIGFPFRNNKRQFTPEWLRQLVNEPH